MITSPTEYARGFNHEDVTVLRVEALYSTISTTRNRNNVPILHDTTNTMAQESGGNSSGDTTRGTAQEDKYGNDIGKLDKAEYSVWLTTRTIK